MESLKAYWNVGRGTKAKTKGNIDHGLGVLHLMVIRLVVFDILFEGMSSIKFMRVHLFEDICSRTFAEDILPEDIYSRTYIRGPVFEDMFAMPFI